MTIKLNRQECLFYQALARKLSDKIASAHEGKSFQFFPGKKFSIFPTIIKPFYQGERSNARSVFGLIQEPYN
jgi:hypothetical protein